MCLKEEKRKNLHLQVKTFYFYPLVKTMVFTATKLGFPINTRNIPTKFEQKLKRIYLGKYLYL